MSDGLPPILKLIAFLAVLAALYEVAPRILWATAGLVVLYVVLANGGKVGELLDAVPAGFTGLVKPDPGTGGGTGFIGRIAAR